MNDLLSERGPHLSFVVSISASLVMEQQPRDSAPTARLQTNTTCRQDLTTLHYTGRLPALVERSILKMSRVGAQQPSCSPKMRRGGLRRTFARLPDLLRKD